MYQGLIAAALISLILTVVAVFFLGKRGPWGSVWTFFLVLFLTLWTLSIYLEPIGPVYWGVAWIPITVAGIIVAIMLIAAMPVPDKTDSGVFDKDTNVVQPPAKTDLPATPIGRFFWVLIVFFIMAIIIGMMNPQMAL